MLTMLMMGADDDADDRENFFSQTATPCCSPCHALPQWVGVTTSKTLPRARCSQSAESAVTSCKQSTSASLAASTTKSHVGEKSVLLLLMRDDV